MTAMYTDRRSRTVTLPFILLGSPIAWLVSLTVSYVGHDFACSAAETGTFTVAPGLLRVGLLVANVVLLAVTVAAGVAGLRVHRATRHSRNAAGTSAFIGLTGVVMAVMFAFGIVLIALNVLVFSTC